MPGLVAAVPVREGQPVEKPHFMPEASSFLLASAISGHVLGGFSGSRPAFFFASKRALLS